jgi:hypothetical protein
LISVPALDWEQHPFYKGANGRMVEPWAARRNVRLVVINGKTGATIASQHFPFALYQFIDAAMAVGVSEDKDGNVSVSVYELKLR